MVGSYKVFNKGIDMAKLSEGEIIDKLIELKDSLSQKWEPEVFFSTVIRINLFVYKISYNQRSNTAGHHHPEEIDVTDCFLNVTGNEARQHHTQCHERRTDCIVGSLEFAFREIHHVKHIGSEAEAITELFDTNRNTDNDRIRRLSDGKINECQA